MQEDGLQVGPTAKYVAQDNRIKGLYHPEDRPVISLLLSLKLI